MGEPLAVAQHVLQRGIQGDDVTRALTLRQCKGSVFKKRIQRRLRILRSHVIAAAVLTPLLCTD